MLHDAARRIQTAVRKSHATARDNAYRLQQEELRCQICYDFPPMAPVFSLCCAAGTQQGAICYGCFYHYCEMHIPPDQRSVQKRSWTACNCTLKLREGAPIHFMGNTYVNRVMDTFRDMHAIECFACQAVFECHGDLFTHLQTECAKLKVSCDQCGAFGERGFIRGVHFQEQHVRVPCAVCGAQVASRDIEAHVAHHTERFLECLATQSHLTTTFWQGLRRRVAHHDTTTFHV